MDAEANVIDIKFTNQRLYAGFGVILGAIFLIIGYYLYKIYYPSTDDAYVNAPLVNMTSKVNGSIKKVYVKNNQYVQKGQLLLELDPADYRPMVEQAQLDILMAKKAAITANQQMTNAQSDVLKAQSDYNYSEQMAVRYTNLYHENAGSQQSMQKFVNDRNIAQHVLDQAKVVLHQATIQAEMAQSKIKLAQVEKENAQRTSSYTRIVAPVSGYVSELNLQTGQVVMAGQKLFGLVDDSKWWIDANFKETQLKRLEPFQKVKVTLDMYDHTYQGEIQSISYASGNTFSLLPPQNATGNWVKVIQRFTVRVVLKNDPKYPLRVGASATVSANTTRKGLDKSHALDESA